MRHCHDLPGFGIDLTGAWGNENTKKHAYKESWDQVDCVLSWKHTSTPETLCS